jgi:hypothetical protein
MKCRKKGAKNQLAFRKRTCYLIFKKEINTMPLHLFEDDVFLMNTFNAIPFPTFVVDDDVRILFWNSAALSLIGNGEVFQQRGGEVLHCLHTMETKDGCGHAPHCKTCIIRTSVNESIHGGKVYRQKTVMDLKSDENIIEFPLLVTASPYQYQQQSLSVLILEDIREIMQIGGLLPICAKCKKIRTIGNQWEPVERYIKKHLADVNFTHGICPDCAKEYFSGSTPTK